MTDIATEMRDLASEAIVTAPEGRALLRKGAAEIERLQTRVAVLEMVINEEVDAYDCADEANRMIVENIRETRRRP